MLHEKTVTSALLHTSSASGVLILSPALVDMRTTGGLHHPAGHSDLLGRPVKPREAAPPPDHREEAAAGDRFRSDAGRRPRA